MIYRIVEIGAGDAYHPLHYKDWIGRYVVKTQVWRKNMPKGWYSGTVDFLDKRRGDCELPHAGFAMVRLKKVSPSRIPKSLMLSMF